MQPVRSGMAAFAAAAVAAGGTDTADGPGTAIGACVSAAAADGPPSPAASTAAAANAPSLSESGSCGTCSAPPCGCSAAAGAPAASERASGPTAGALLDLLGSASRAAVLGSGRGSAGGAAAAELGRECRAGDVGGTTAAADGVGGRQTQTGMSSLGSRLGRARDTHKFRRSCSTPQTLSLHAHLYKDFHIPFP